MVSDSRTAGGARAGGVLAGGVLAGLAAMALAGCAPISGSDGYGNEPIVENAAQANAPATIPPEPGDEVEQDAESVEKQAPEDLTDRLIGKRVPKMGRVVTDEDGWILYRFDKDSADPPASNCNGECERVWPPAYTDGNPIVKGVDAELVGTVTRDDGTRQLTINGWPVYRYVGDKKPGKWAGQAVDGLWYVIDPSGKKNLTCLPEGTPKAVAPPPEDAGEDDARGEEGAQGDGAGGYSY